MEMRGTKKGGKRGIAVLERGTCVAEPWFTYLNNNNTTGDLVFQRVCTFQRAWSLR